MAVWLGYLVHSCRTLSLAAAVRDARLRSCSSTIRAFPGSVPNTIKDLPNKSRGHFSLGVIRAVRLFRLSIVCIQCCLSSGEPTEPLFFIPLSSVLSQAWRARQSPTTRNPRRLRCPFNSTISWFLFSSLNPFCRMVSSLLLSPALRSSTSTTRSSYLCR